jgi:hypothetical protein
MSPSASGALETRRWISAGAASVGLYRWQRPIQDRIGGSGAFWGQPLRVDPPLSDIPDITLPQLQSQIIVRLRCVICVWGYKKIQ